MFRFSSPSHRSEGNHEELYTVVNFHLKRATVKRLKIKLNCASTEGRKTISPNCPCSANRQWFVKKSPETCVPFFLFPSHRPTRSHEEPYTVVNFHSKHIVAKWVQIEQYQSTTDGRKVVLPSKFLSFSRFTIPLTYIHKKQRSDQFPFKTS